MTLTFPVMSFGRADEADDFVELPGFVFGLSKSQVEKKNPLVHQVVVAQLAAARQGTAATKTRAQVSGGGAKPYRQKGTGRARQGSTRAPQFTGGGVVHGPTPRTYEQRTPKKMKAGALRVLLSDRALHDQIHVVTRFVNDKFPSTRAARDALDALGVSKNVLVVVRRENDDVTWKSLGNLDNVHLLDQGQLNAYDVAKSDDVIFTKDALLAFVERVSGSPTWRSWVDEDQTFSREQLLRMSRQAEVDLSRLAGAPTTEQVEKPLGMTDGTSIVDYTGSLTGEDIRVAAMKHTDIRTFTSEVPGVDGTAFETDQVDGVSIERHQDFVLVSWPTALTGESAVHVLFDALDSGKNSQPPVMFATLGEETVEYEGSIDREYVSKIAPDVESLRLELDRETLAWRLPTDGERQARFIAYEFELSSERLTRLLDMTAGPQVRSLITRVLGKKPAAMLPLQAAR